MMVKKYKELILVISAYLIVGIIFTYPLISHLFSRIYAQGSDPFGTLYNFWRDAHHQANYTFPNAPLFVLLAKIGTILVGEIQTYNIFTYSGFILTGLATYLLSKKICKNKLAAFASGLILVISSFRLAHGPEFISFADLSGMVFFIYFIISAQETHQKSKIILSGIFFILTTLFNPQYGFFVTIIFVVFLLFLAGEFVLKNKFSIGKLNSPAILFSLLTIIFSLSIIGVFNYSALQDSIAIHKGEQPKVAPIRSKTELNFYSARWLYYLYPPPSNPLFGKLTQPIYDRVIKSTKSNITEVSLYLGWIPILLAIYGVWQVTQIKNSRFKKYICFFTALGLVGLYFSFAPTINIFGYQLKTPAYWLFNYLPFFRAYSRFGLLVILAVVMLAGIGLSTILEKIKSGKIALFLYCLTILLILSEFLNFPPVHSINVSHAAMPTVYQWLENQPKGVLAEYPLLPTEESRSYDYLLWERYHQMPLIYGAAAGSPADELRKTILDPQNPETISKLKTIGVLYLMIHQNLYTPENAKKYPEEYDYGKVPKIESDQLELLGKFGEDVIYRIK